VLNAILRTQSPVLGGTSNHLAPALTGWNTFLPAN